MEHFKSNNKKTKNKKDNIDFVVHGDDITTTADGVDSYHLVKSAGRYKFFFFFFRIEMIKQ